MNKSLIPLTAIVVLATGFSLNWLQGSAPQASNHRLSMQELRTSEAAYRHRHVQPMHWRAMVLQPH